MMTKEQKELANSLKWWHRIRLSSDPEYITKGMVDHGVGNDVETRFGLPANMTGMKVLDVGAYDGLFSFEAEKRGAQFVAAIDTYQYCGDDNGKRLEANRPFKLAKEVLDSHVQFTFDTLETYTPQAVAIDYKFDYIFHFGILYHVENPLDHVILLMKLVNEGGTILVETAISNLETEPVLEYRPGHDNDPTNFYYPNGPWIEQSFINAGAKSIKCIYNDGARATFKVQA